ncbi:MAG: hypothetical protein RL375_977 [Pseudomonadota bacterium]|jgi:Ethanolamine utilization protein EutJ (predicted chaperonin)
MNGPEKISDSNWGDLEPAHVERIKHDIARSVAVGVSDALRNGAVRDAIAEGVTVGLQQAVMDQRTFDVLAAHAATALRRSATQASGRIVIDGITGLGKRVVFVVSIAVLVYAIGGWSALAHFWKFFTQASTP